MEATLSGLSVLFQLLAGLAGLCLGVSFSKQERARFPILRRLDGLRPVLFVLTAVGIIGAAAFDRAAKRIETAAQVATQASIVSRMDSIIRTSLGTSPVTPDARSVAKFGTDLAVTLALSGEGAFAAGRHREALGMFLDADRVSPIASLKARIADSYFHLGEFSKTVEYELAAQDLAPDWSGPPYMLAHALIRLGRVDEARAAAERSCGLGFPAACELRQRL